MQVQRGSLIIYCLIIVLALSYLIAPALSLTGVSSRLIANMQDKQRAFWTAMTTLSRCETRLLNHLAEHLSGNSPELSGSSEKLVEKILAGEGFGVFPANYFTVDWWKSDELWEAHGLIVSGDESGIPEYQSRCITELVETTSEGAGSEDTATRYADWKPYETNVMATRADRQAEKPLNLYVRFTVRAPGTQIGAGGVPLTLTYMRSDVLVRGK